MDKVARDNQTRWEALAQANVSFSRPALNLTPATARQLLDPQQCLGRVAGQRVLCLASGGGQQAVAFGLLGAQVTVYDLAETQLQRDREAAAHYGLPIQVVQGDMRDLACFAAGTFDGVYQPPSLNFVPEARQVFAEVARVLCRGGWYHLTCDNPFAMGLDERDWNGTAYPLHRPYVDGEEIQGAHPCWEVWDETGTCQLVPAPRQFRHTLGTVVHGLIEQGFVIRGLWEAIEANPAAEVGTWAHFTQVVPPLFTLWSRYCPFSIPKVNTVRQSMISLSKG